MDSEQYNLLPTLNLNLLISLIARHRADLANIEPVATVRKVNASSLE